MDSGIAAIISASVGGFVSLVIFIGTSILTKMNYDKPAKIKIYEKQLINVLEPLEKLYGNEGSIVSDDSLKQTQRIINKNFALVPVEVFKAYKAMLKDTSTNENLDVFRDTISSHYNWVRKNLSFPYDWDAIRIGYLGIVNIVSILVKNIKSSALIVTIVFIFLMLQSILTVYLDPELMKPISSLIFTLFFYISISFAAITLYPIILKMGIKNTKNRKATDKAKGNGYIHISNRSLVNKNQSDKNI